MIEFRDMTSEDIDRIRQCNKVSGYTACEYSAGNLFIWKNAYHVKIAYVGGMCCIVNDFEDFREYLYPFGEGDTKAVLLALMEDSKERGLPFGFFGIADPCKEELEAFFPGMFEFKDCRDDWDYVYTTEKLTKLSGSKLHGKRNHIARFKDNDNWEFEVISEENFDECIAMNNEWCRRYSAGKSESVSEEECAVKSAFANYRKLGFVGGLLRIDGKVIAYTLGEAITDDMMVVHFEKAFADIQGAYPMINQQFVANCCQQYRYINREEDMGEEGLRKAKLSYGPDIMVEKFAAVLKDKN